MIRHKRLIMVCMCLLVASNMNFTSLDVNVLVVLGLEKCFKLLNSSAVPG
jgi:hypothetical protein